MNPVSQQHLLDPVTTGLEKVRTIFREKVSSESRIVHQMGQYVADGSGKMLRPAILLLTGGMLGSDSPALPTLGALVEMLHTATLVHDDIIDEAATRRGRPSVNAAFGNEMTVLMGDWIYMTAFQVAVAQRSFPILDVLMDVTRRMVEGELIQLDFIGRADITETQSEEIAIRKTACLFSACTRLAGIAAGKEGEELERLGAIGLDLGLAFQLVDDLLDFTSEAALLGKPVMNDLREGKVTLPVIFLLQKGNPTHRQMVETVLSERSFDSVRPEELLGALESTGCLTEASRVAHARAASAREAILGYPPSPCRDSLATIAEFILARRH